MPEYLDRGLWPETVRQLQQRPLVILEGARGTGKTSFGQELVRAGVMAEFRSFTDPGQLDAVKAAPFDYVANLPHGTVIDEAQLHEPVTLAIKSLIDQDRTPGRFLLTGSTRMKRNALGGSDPFAGRVGEPLRLDPLTIGERHGLPTTVIDALFDDPAGLVVGPPLGRSDLADLIGQSGLPALATMSDRAVAVDLARGYIPLVMSAQAFENRKVQKLNSLARYIAGRTATLVNVSDFARKAELSRNTVHEYLTLLQEALLVHLLPAWRSSKDKSETDTPKVHFFDTGVVVATARLRPAREPEALGPLTETLIVTELRAQAQWSPRVIDCYHWRLGNRYEVDLVLEDAQSGDLVAIEVKTNEAVESSDFNGIRALRSTTPNRSVTGIVLHPGRTILPHGNDLWALPIATLWADAPSRPQQPRPQAEPGPLAQRLHREYSGARLSAALDELESQLSTIAAAAPALDHTLQAVTVRAVAGQHEIQLEVNRLGTEGDRGHRLAVLTARLIPHDSEIVFESRVVDSQGNERTTSTFTIGPGPLPNQVAAGLNPAIDALAKAVAK